MPHTTNPEKARASQTIAQHTPGPWHLGAQLITRGEISRDIIAPNGRRIATLHHRADEPTAGGTNARLIAAAPELARTGRVACAVIEDAAAKLDSLLKWSNLSTELRGDLTALRNSLDEALSLRAILTQTPSA